MCLARSSGIDTVTAIFSGTTGRVVVVQIVIEGTIVADSVVGAVNLAFLEALAFLGAGPHREAGAVEGVGAAMEEEGLDSSVTRRLSRWSKRLRRAVKWLDRLPKATSMLKMWAEDVDIVPARVVA